MVKIDLDPKYLKQVKTILKQSIPNLDVWAYGSRVNGNCHDASDLDLVIRNTEDLQKPIKNLSELKQVFRDSDLPIFVDLMDWACLSDSYREEIKKKHQVIRRHP